MNQKAIKNSEIEQPQRAGKPSEECTAFFTRKLAEIQEQNAELVRGSHQLATLTKQSASG